MKLSVFNGGLSKRISPFLIQPNQATKLENVDLSDGTLSPLYAKKEVGLTLDTYSYYSAKEGWLTSKTFREYLEFQEQIIITDRKTRLQSYSGGTWNFLGIEKPTSKLTLSRLYSKEPWEKGKKYYVGDTVVYTSWYVCIEDHTATKANRAGSDITIWRSINLKNAASIDLWNVKTVYKAGQTVQVDDDFFLCVSNHTSKNADKPKKTEPGVRWALLKDTTPVYQYVYTYYNKNDGTESAPSPVSDEFRLITGTVLVDGFAKSTDPQVTDIRLYRVGGNIATFTLVSTYSTTTTQVNDTLADSDIDGRLLKTEINGVASVGLQYLTTAYSMLFGALGVELRFTPISQPDNWPPTYSLRFDDVITGIGQVSGGLLVFTNFKSYLVVGNGPTALSQQLLRGDVGCSEFHSIQQIANGQIVWYFDKSLYVSDGSRVQNMTRATLGPVDLRATNSVVHDEVYYCKSAKQEFLAFDYRFEPKFQFIATGVESLFKGNNILYGKNPDSSQIWHIFYKELAAYIKFQTYLDFRYMSPIFMEKSINTVKTYTKILVALKGSLTISVFINRNLVAVFKADEDRMASKQFKIPQDFQLGETIQFEITGTGRVYELEYLVDG